MRIIDCRQQTESWDELRHRPTASEFGNFVTPARGDYSKQATAYAAKIISKRKGAYIEPPPSFWMEWGIEHESAAKRAYTALSGNTVTEVGFIMPDHSDSYGGSPDGLVGVSGMIEVKCPAPETLIGYHAKGELPSNYKPQVQGLLMISGREWCDFFGYHPALPPFLLRVHADEQYQTKIAEGLLRLLEEIKDIERKLTKTIF